MLHIMKSSDVTIVLDFVAVLHFLTVICCDLGTNSSQETLKQLHIPGAVCRCHITTVAGCYGCDAIDC